MTPKQTLHEALDSVLEPGPSRTTLANQRPRVIAAMRAEGRRRDRSPGWLGLGVALALVLLAVGGFHLARRAPAELTSSWHGQELAAHSIVTGHDPAGESLDFSDGSKVRVARGAELELSRVSSKAVELALNGGWIHAHVAKGTGRNWSISAGPYQVRVVGTDFTVDWSASSREIDIRVNEGRVLVFGFQLPPEGVSLIAGGRLHRYASLESEATPHAAPPPATVTEPVASERASIPLRAGASAVARTGAPRPAVVAESPGWRALAASQHYVEALAAAREEGFESLLSTLGDKDLLLLANTARYAGAAPEAKSALAALRGRFPGSPSATVGALVLASIEERAKNPAEAARWLRTYLAESPSGELAAGARARLLNILVRAGERAEARRVAADYLRYDPNGPYAAEARGQLDAGSLR